MARHARPARNATPRPLAAMVIIHFCVTGPDLTRLRLDTKIDGMLRRVVTCARGSRETVTSRRQPDLPICPSSRMPAPRQHNATRTTPPPHSQQHHAVLQWLQRSGPGPCAVSHSKERKVALGLLGNVANLHRRQHERCQHADRRRTWHRSYDLRVHWIDIVLIFLYFAITAWRHLDLAFPIAYLASSSPLVSDFVAIE